MRYWEEGGRVYSLGNFANGRSPKMPLKITKQAVDDQRSLVSTGDQNLDTIRNMFASSRGRATTLDNEGLLIACAVQEDDDDEMMCVAIERIEKGDFELVDQIAAE